jgi:hypothetical protein
MVARHIESGIPSPHGHRQSIDRMIYAAGRFLADTLTHTGETLISGSPARVDGRVASDIQHTRHAAQPSNPSPLSPPPCSSAIPRRVLRVALPSSRQCVLHRPCHSRSPEPRSSRRPGLAAQCRRGRQRSSGLRKRTCRTPDPKHRLRATVLNACTLWCG